MAAQVIIARRPDEIAFYSPDATTPSHVIPGSNYVASTDGSLLAAITPDGVDVYEGAGPKKLLSVADPGAVLAAFSPGCGYLVTVTKPQKGPDGQVSKNLKVWDLSSGACLQALPQKLVGKDHWPALQWGGDDSTFAHLVTNTVHIYTRADNFAAYRRVTIKGVTGVALSPLAVADASSLPAGLPASAQPRSLLCAFVPEIKGSPAFAALYDFGAAAPGSTLEPSPLVKKAFFRTSGAQIMWNKTGSTVLVLGFTDFDVTNQSYYGEQKLHFLPADPAKADAACTVALPKEGPVHDVKWSPTGEHFAVVAGFIPAKVMLYDSNCKPVYDMGSGPYNVVRWNPFGRFLAVAGFGNLPGDIVFYDKKASGTCRQMGAVRSPSVDAHWSPDGRTLLTATTAPRLRVDNNYKAFTYYGQQVSSLAFPVLFEANWMPTPPGAFTDRPQSPERLAASDATAAAAGAAVAKGPAAAASPKPSGYVPPHLRGAGGAAAAGTTGGAPKPQFSLAYDPNDKGGRVTTATTRAKQVPPGAEFLAFSGKASSKNAKKRANKKKKAGGDEDSGDEEEQQQGTSEAMAQLSVEDQQAAGGEAGSALDPIQKRLRALQKKLRDIEKLKERQAKGDKLEPEQLTKIAGEAALVAEINELGG